ncbi:uncharacterized protein LOC131165045 [Malania oleifera]|uniref:uncharacterized protein LOC131165045 n=1 Tax=Malania oleifera TaxID=397392 RepID=UPI0025AD9F94|nr:uncharacterized protein LOC131165045 [Malania oleifera]
MEPAKIDWRSIESTFVKDDLYEHINAPQWVDFSVCEDSVNDEAWFCRPDCRHPKTAEDFLKSTPTSKLKRLGLVDISDMLSLGDRNRRDANLKRRGAAQPSVLAKNSPRSKKFTEDSENQNPNLHTPPHHQAKPMKAAFKSSTEKKKLIDDSSQDAETPWLKRTLSARNLFAGRDILNQVTEFCHELKRLAMKAKDRENTEKLDVKKSPVGGKKQMVREAGREILGELDEREKDRKPLLEMSKERTEAVGNSSGKQRRKKRADEAENTPLSPLSVDLKNIKRREENLLQIRTNPPTPQCFSAAHDATKSSPAKPSRSRLPERGIRQELEQSSNKEMMKNQTEDNGNNARSVSIVAEREAKALDVFWFLKPCTLSS